MISKQDLERFLQREESGSRVLSIFLDMSVNSDNKRTHTVFLAQKRSQLDEMEGTRRGGQPDAFAQALARVEEWLATSFREENRGVAIYTEIDGDWFEALQFPVPVQNRLVIDNRPLIGPLAQVIVQLDEWLFDDKLRSPDDLAMLLDQVRRLLSGQIAADVFHEEYRRALQDSPEVVVAHGRVAALLSESKP